MVTKPTEESAIADKGDISTSFEDALILENFEMAQTQLEEFKHKYGASATYQHRLAQLRWKEGKIARAYDILKTLYYEMPVYMRDHNDFFRIKQEAIQEKLDRAKAQWKQIVVKASKFIEENPEEEKTAEAAAPYIKNFWTKHYEEIESVANLYRLVLAIESFDTAALSGMVQCYSELKDKEKENLYKNQLREAKSHWKSIISKRSAAVAIAANKQIETGHFDGAIEILNLGLDTDPTNLELLLLKAENLQKIRHFQDALACVYVAVKLNPKNSKALRLKKSIEAQKFDMNLKEGLDYLFSAEQDSPGSPQQLSKVEAALSRFLDALSYDAQNLCALAGIYRCHLRAGKPLKAQKTLERIRTIDSSFDVYSIFRDKKGKSEEEESCFVATRLFGSSHPITNSLRFFRDNYLKKCFPGKVFVQLYRRIGPSLARIPGKSPLLPIIRTILKKIV